jgi:hypothetical protein
VFLHSCIQYSITFSLTGPGIETYNIPYQLTGTEIACAMRTGIDTEIEFKPLGIE